MVVAGYILVAIGSGAGLIGDILMLKLAYRRGIGWLMGFLTLGPFC